MIIILKKAQKYAEELNLDWDDLTSKTKWQCKSTIKELSLSKLKEKLKAEPLHGQFHQMIEQGHIDKKATFEWMKGTGLKGGKEATIVAIQEQAVTTRYIKKHIHNTTDSDTCRMCNTMPETIAHVVSGCTTLAATSYLKRYNSVAKIIHLELAKKFNLIEVKESLKWYSHTPEKVLEIESSKLLWDFQINNDRTIIASKPDIICQDKDQQTLHHRYCNTSRWKYCKEKDRENRQIHRFLCSCANLAMFVSKPTVNSTITITGL